MQSSQPAPDKTSGNSHPPRFRTRHYLWCLLLLGLLGIIGYFQRSNEVFPSASIDLKLPRAQVLDISSAWAAKLGYASRGAIRSTIFNYDDSAKTFLEYELGLTAANRLMKKEIPVWYWSTRLCRSLQLEEFSCDIDPKGNLVAFEHSLENDLALPSIAHAKAKEMAIDFIVHKAGLSLAGYKLIVDGESAQAHRTDHAFTFEDTQHDYRGAKLRIYAGVSGNQVTSFGQYLHIPEKWTRQFSQLRSYNKALEEVATIFFVIFNLATFFAFVWAFTAGLLRWRFAIAIALLVALMDFLESLNSMPSAIRNYTTTMAFNSYMVDVYISAVKGALGQFLQTMILAGAAESFYRLLAPGKVALEKIFTNAGLRSRQVVAGIIAGHGMFGIHLGWIIFYYLLGRPLGFWSPLEVKNTESLSTNFPFFSSMNVGVTAAIFEEFTYRVLGLTIFKKLVSNFWLANLLQAASWAFMHSNYPQEPPYARGVELTFVGMFYGYMLRRFGLIACVISHYVFDSFLGVTPLLTSSQPALQFSSLIAISPFLILAAIAFWFVRQKGWFENEGAISNESIPRGTTAAALEELGSGHPYDYPKLSGKKRLFLAVIVILATVVEFGYSFPMIGKQAQLRISRDEAITQARKCMLDNQISPAGRIECAWLSKGIDYQQMQYIFEKSNFQTANRLANMPGQPLVWRVRFFRPLDPEEYMVTLDQKGKPISLAVTQAEDAPGARLSESTARSAVEDYLLHFHKEISPFKFDDGSEKERKARTDYNFRFDIPQYAVADAKFKVDVDTIGSSVANYDQLWDLPDKWIFEQSRQDLRTQICGYVTGLAGLALLVAGIWWMIGIARSGAIHWRAPIMLSLAVVLLVIPQTFNDLPEFYVGYGTDTPLFSYYTVEIVKQILTAVSSIAMVVSMAAFALAAFRLISPRLSPATIFKTAMTRAAGHTDFWLDAILVGYAAGIGSCALGVVMAAAHSYISPVATMAPLESFCTMANVLSPTLDTLTDALSKGIQYLLLAGLLVGLYAKYFKSFGGYFIFCLLVCLIYPSTEKYWQDYVLGVAGNLASFIFIWIFVAKFARQNLLAYAFMGATATTVAALRVLILHGPDLYRQDILVIATVLVSPLIVLAASYYRQPKRLLNPEST